MSTTKSAVTTSPVTTTAKAPGSVAVGEAPKGARRPRRGLKRLAFAVPKKMPLPVKALWQGASEEEKAIAHKTATAILKTWLGKSSRDEAAKDLGLSGVRLWQLSQQAVCGLVVGCLRQPRFRGRPPAGGYGALEEGVGALRKKITLLERELDGSKRLIEVMKDLPGHREASSATGAEGAMAHGRPGGSARAGRVAGAADRTTAAGPGAEASDVARA